MKYSYTLGALAAAFTVISAGPIVTKRQTTAITDGKFPLAETELKHSLNI
jgi:hypothetical protein